MSFLPALPGQRDPAVIASEAKHPEMLKRKDWIA
jgi:hypothetical protein